MPKSKIIALLDAAYIKERDLFFEALLNYLNKCTSAEKMKQFFRDIHSISQATDGALKTTAKRLKESVCQNTTKKNSK